MRNSETNAMQTVYTFKMQYRLPLHSIIILKKVMRETRS
jgi:hypothetical protein